MTGQALKPIDPSSYTKKTILNPVSFQFDQASINEILKIIKKSPDDEIATDFIVAMENQVGMYKEVKRQEFEFESNKQVVSILNKTLNAIDALITSLDEIAQSDEILNRLNILLPSLRSPEELIAFNINRNNQPLPNLVNDTLLDNKLGLEYLGDLLLEAKKLGSQNTKGGRPKKDTRIIYIRNFAKVYEFYIGKPALTEYGQFESIVKICLDNAHDVIEDIHRTVVEILKSP